MMLVSTSVRGMGEGKGQALGEITSGWQFINEWLLGNDGDARRSETRPSVGVARQICPGLG